MDSTPQEHGPLPLAPLPVEIDEARAMRMRIVSVLGDIDAEQAAKVCMQLLQLHAASSSDAATLVVNCESGSVADGLAIYDIIRYVKLPLRTHCSGSAIGMAALLVASGASGSRTAIPDAEFGLGHLSVAEGQPTTEIERTRDILTDLYFRRTKMMTQQILDAWKNEYRYSAAEAVEMGFIDRIADDVELAGSL